MEAHPISWKEERAQATFQVPSPIVPMREVKVWFLFGFDVSEQEVVGFRLGAPPPSRGGEPDCRSLPAAAGDCAHGPFPPGTPEPAETRSGYGSMTLQAGA